MVFHKACVQPYSLLNYSYPTSFLNKLFYEVIGCDNKLQTNKSYMTQMISKNPFQATWLVNKISSSISIQFPEVATQSRFEK